ncbi:hypothetical protein [Hymenobacter convexus]|uniref:hypothetical protein n=1 Tax=Hymenobacter sp. CA1UV-4 TaxID=3063782 RepID=UPI0027132738|nr:hypothetical protein [Hymenobacter sp. CA1UV-4]MDO7851186.1 hypothetical protein [Hymenobacter sp. CA1UV-4]
MRKILCLGALLTASIPSFAQTARPAASAAAVQYEHCILVVTGREYDHAELEYGQHFKDGSKDEAMAKTDQVVRKLRSAVAALNYLSSQGWECVGVSTASPNTFDQTGYLMRRAK